MDFVKEIKVLDLKTGEIKSNSSVTWVGPWDDEKGWAWRRNSVAIRSCVDVPFPEKMGVDDIGRICLLSRHTSKSANMLVKRYRPMKAEEIGEVVGLGRSQSYAFIKRMMTFGMIAKVTVHIDNTQHVKFFLNPVYFLRGKYIDVTLYQLFQESLDKYLPEDAKREFRRKIDKE